jgi:HEAT repeat protein
MKMQRFRVWHMILLVAASAAFLSVFQFRRTVYDPTFARIRRVQYAADAAGKVAALRELMAEEDSGPQVVETMLEALRDPDPAVRALAAQGLADEVFRTTVVKKEQDDLAGAVKAALTDGLSDRDPSVCVQCASGLSTLNVKSEESFAILLRAARTPTPASQSVGGIDDRFRALGDLAVTYRDRPESLPTIFAAMSDRDARVRGQGTTALNLYLRGPSLGTEPVVEALLARLDDDDDAIRSTAAQALSRIGRRAAPRAVPLLIRNLDLPRTKLQVATAFALGTFGLDATEARPALRALAEGNADPDVREGAHKALAKIEKACQTFDADTLPGLIADLGNAEPSLRAGAASELAQYGPRAKAAVPALTQALGDPDRKVRQAASAALKAAGAPPRRGGE